MTTGPRPFRRRLLINTASTGAANVWAMVVALVSLPLLLQGLGAEVFGLWVLLQTFSAVNGWLSLGDLGLTAAAPRFLARAGATDDHGRQQVLIGTTLTLFAGFGVLWSGLLILIGSPLLPRLFDVPEPLRGEFGRALVFVAMAAAIDQATRGCQTVLEGLQRVDLSRWSDVIRRTAVIGSATAVALATGSLSSTAGAAMGGSLVGLLAAIVILRMVDRGALLSFDSGAARDLLGYGKTVAALRPIGVIHRMMDRVIVGIILGPAAVAVVEVAVQIQNAAEAVLSASSYAVVPGAAHVEARADDRAMRDLILTGTRYSLLATLPFVIAPAILAGPVIAVWVPSQSAAQTSVVLALAYVAVTAPLQVGSNLLVGIGRAGAVLRAAAGAIAVNLGLTLVLVPWLGVPGAFLATLGGGLVLVPALGRSVLAATGLDRTTFVREALRPVLAPAGALAAVCLGVLLVVDEPLLALVASGLLGGAAYLATTVRSSLAPGELNSLRTTLQKSAPVG